LNLSGFNVVLEGSDGLLAFSKTNFYLEQGKVDLKLANGHMELTLGCSCRIIWNMIRQVKTTKEGG
jgi:hypothetical protein